MEIRNKSEEALRSQIEDANARAKESGEPQFPLDDADLSLTEKALRDKYGDATVDRYVEAVRSRSSLAAKASKEAYRKAYGTQTEKMPSWLTTHLERRGFVEGSYALLEPPVRAIDIGCGNGKNTSWIGDVGGNEWIGVDTVDRETLGVQLPRNGKFMEGSIEDPAFRDLPELRTPFDLVVDQGAVLTSLQDTDRIGGYLSDVSSMLQDNGVFVTLVTYNHKEDESYDTTLPDGRKRRFFAMKDFSSPPVSDLFDVESASIHVYAPGSPANPYFDKEVAVIQVALRKKPKGSAKV